MSDRINDQDIEVEIFDAVRSIQDPGNPVQPTRLNSGDSFCFSCHKDVACWNKCCHGADITLTPADILRLCTHLDIRPTELLAQYTVPAFWERSDLPVAKIKMGGADGTGPCPFMNDEGCSVYENRPATCRYYPLGLASMKMKGDTEQQDFYFLVKESHCEGHAEKKKLSVDAFRDEQGAPEYDDINRGWIDIMMKMASWRILGGPWGKEPTPQTKRMFFMATTDMDQFRQFVFGSKFLDSYEIDPDVIEILKTDDVALQMLAFDWLKNVLFNDPTISLKEPVLQQAMAKAREDLGVT